MKLNTDILAQAYIKEAGGLDSRCFVVGNRVIAAMQRPGPPANFANLHQGGKASLVKLTTTERNTAVHAAKVGAQCGRCRFAELQ